MPGPLLFLLLVSLFGYAAVVGLSIVPVNPNLISRAQYTVFIVYGGLFYVVATFIHVAAPLFLYDTFFVRPENRRKKLALFVVPVLMLAYFGYVIVCGD